jgi:hypothetical protein
LTRTISPLYITHRPEEHLENVKEIRYVFNAVAAISISELFGTFHRREMKYQRFCFWDSQTELTKLFHDITDTHVTWTEANGGASVKLPQNEVTLAIRVKGVTFYSEFHLSSSSFQ